MLNIERQVKLILPAIRNEIVKELSERQYKQKDIAKFMKLTTACVSQYISKKRGNKYKLPKKFFGLSGTTYLVNRLISGVDVDEILTVALIKVEELEKEEEFLK